MLVSKEEGMEAYTKKEKFTREIAKLINETNLSVNRTIK